MTSWLFSEVILGRKRHFERNLGSPVKNCPRISLICLSESIRREPILIGCDIPYVVSLGSKYSMLAAFTIPGMKY